MRRILNFLGLKSNLIVILVGVILLELGERMGERFIPIYVMALGGSSLVVGLVNALDNLLGALYSYPGGLLSDKFGYKRSLIFFNLVAILGYLIVVIFPYWWAVVIGSVFFTCWSSISLPAIMSAISQILPSKKQTMGVSMHSMVRRLPMALGPLLGGYLIAVWGEKNGVRAAFIVSIGLAILAILFQNYFLKEPVKEEPIKELNNGGNKNNQLPSTNVWSLLLNMSSNLKSLLISDILIRFCEQIPYAFVVIWCMKKVRISAVEFGVLTTIEMVTAILIYIPVAYLVEKKGSKKPFVAITFLFFSFFPLMLYFSNSMELLVIAFIIRGLKEFGEPTRKALILSLAQEGQKGAMYGAYYLVRDVIVSLSAFAGGFLWMISPALNLFSAFFIGIVGVVYFWYRCEE